MAERCGARTVYGNYNFVSTAKNRSAWLTVYFGSKKVLQRRLSHEQMDSYVKKLRMERIEWLRQFQNLNPAIIKAITP